MDGLGGKKKGERGFECHARGAGNFPSRNDVGRRVPERRPTTLTMLHPTNS